MRPAGLTNGEATGQVRTYEPGDGGTAYRIARADVAAYMLDQLSDGANLRRAVNIATS